jgi:DNA-binding GntR family transcriptional regulator
VRTKVTAQQIYQTLRHMILDMALAPGTRFTETQVAEHFQVSRTPVREALQRLEVENQITIRPKQGCFVRAVDLKQIRDYYDVRVAIELLAVERACTHMSDAALQALAAAWNPQHLAFGNEADDTLKQAEEDFHLALAQGSGNPALVRYLADINDHIRVVRRLGWPDFTSIQDTYQEHFDICQLILARDVETARATMLAHIRKSQNQADRITLAQLSQPARNPLTGEVSLSS